MRRNRISSVSKTAEPFEVIPDWLVCPCGAKTKIKDGQHFEIIGGYQEEGKPKLNLWGQHICPGLKDKINKEIASHPTGDEQAVAEIKRRIVTSSNLALATSH